MSVQPPDALSGDYTGPLRPQVHFSPPKGFMNDPNGMFRDSKGIWHLYYQYNPTGLTSGNQHWGHATSKDLYHWTNQPIALFRPDAETGVFSGCIVIDKDNTSGLFKDTKDGVVAIYTLHTAAEQTQGIAVSHDGGYTFQPYAHNPVLSVGSHHFRDPKVIWYKDHWVMVIALAADFTVSIYTSPNLIDWTLASNFSHYGLLGLQYECPNLIEMPIRGSTEKAWVMYVSLNPCGPLGGSTAQYFVGDFDGTHFTPYDNAARIADFGKDNYASQWFYGLGEDEEPVSIAWASNWQYCDDTPTDVEGWRSAMTVARRNYLTRAHKTGWLLGSEPYDLAPITGRSLLHHKDLHNDSVSLYYTPTPSGALHFRIRNAYPAGSLQSSSPTLATVRFTFSSSKSGETFKGGYFFSTNNAGHIWLDRGGTKGFDNPFYTDKFSVAQEAPDFAKVIDGIIDRSVFEVFLDKGDLSGTTVLFPKERLDTLSFSTEGLVEGMKVEVEVWELNSTWAGEDNQ